MRRVESIITVARMQRSEIRASILTLNNRRVNLMCLSIRMTSRGYQCGIHGSHLVKTATRLYLSNFFTTWRIPPLILASRHPHMNAGNSVAINTTLLSLASVRRYFLCSANLCCWYVNFFSITASVAMISFLEFVIVIIHFV
jgi:hypothetical protein